jgi:transposase
MVKTGPRKLLSEDRTALIAKARRLRATGLSYRVIAERLGVHHTTIRTWVGIPDPYGSFDRGITL